MRVPSPASRRWAALALAAAAACSDESPKPAPTGDPGAAAQASSAGEAPANGSPGASTAAQRPAATEPDDAGLGVLPAPLGELRDPRIADKYARTDSKYDGWDTETFNERAGKQLSALGKLIAHPEELASELAAERLGALVDPAFEAHDLRPEVVPVELAGPLRVARAAEPAEGAAREVAFRGIDGAAGALREVGDWLEHAGDAVAKFKIVSVEPGEGSVVTRVYVQAKGRPASGARQHNATWRITWTPIPAEPADAPPKVTRIELEELTESLLPGDGAPLFAEATEAVLGGEASFREQLHPSLEHWTARIDKALGISLIGHEGLALGDADGDLLDDLYVCQPGGLPNRLYLRRADGTLADVSREAGVDFLDPSRSALFVDLDGDGDQDLAVEQDPEIVLLENVSSPGKPKLELRARVRAPSTTSLSAADYDSDGDLDLYCCGYVVPDEANVTPLPYHDANNGRPNTMLRNDIAPEGWAFADVTREIGLDENNRRFSFASAWEDYDDDGDLDLYVANDFGRNNLYRNAGGHFHDVAAAAGVEDLAAGMGVTWGDYDLDGRIDLYVSNMFSSAGERVTYQRRFLPEAGGETRTGFQRHARGNSLFRNLGDGTFADVSERAGVTMGRWSWGAIFTDFDDDGLSDLFVPNGFVTGEDPEDL